MKPHKKYKFTNLLKFKIILIVLFFCSCSYSNLDGNVFDYDTEQPLKNVFVSINGTTAETDSTGYFSVQIKENTKCVIVLKKEGYAAKVISREPDSLNRFSKRKLKKNKIYLLNKETDFINSSKRIKPEN